MRHALLRLFHLFLDMGAHISYLISQHHSLLPFYSSVSLSCVLQTVSFLISLQRPSLLMDILHFLSLQICNIPFSAHFPPAQIFQVFFSLRATLGILVFPDTRGSLTMYTLLDVSLSLLLPDLDEYNALIYANGFLLL